MRPSPVVRLARIGAPTLVAALLVTGVAVAASPSAQQEVLAEPAVQSSTAAADTTPRDAQADRVNRSTTRDALTPGEIAAKADAAAAVAKEVKAEKAAAAKKKARAAKKAAAAKKEAAEKKEAAAKKAAEAKAAADKRAADAKAVADVAGAKYATVALNIRTRAAASAGVRSVLTTGAKVSVTSVKTGEWQQVVADGQAGWVRAEYLAATKPVAKKATSESSSSNASSSSKSSSKSSSTSGGIAGGACSSSSVESGLTADAIRVHRAICAKFPQVKSFGGVRADSLPEHPSGRALDAMISDSSVGWEIANWVRANRQALGVSEVLFAQKIWTVQRNGEGWRSFSDRGSVSANHYDHVHITVYGSSGTS